MKLGNKGVQSSFGLPEELEQQVSKRNDPKPEEIKKAVGGPTLAETELQAAVKSDVEIIMESLGFDFTAEDFQQLVFQGSVDKEVEVVKGKLKATFHSLKVKEWEEVDELLTKEINDVPMTKEGMDVRRGLLSISYGITHLQGNPLSQPMKNTDGSLDTRKMASERRRKISEMAPSVVNLMLAKHANFTRMLDLITSDPGEHLKNS